MRLVYLLPKHKFFAEGRRGRVAHAIGVARGLSACGVRVTVISGPGTRAAFENDDIRCVEVDGEFAGFLSEQRWTVRAIEALETERRDKQVDAVIVRYAVSNGFRFSSWFHKATGVLTCFEVNSLAYHQYHSLPSVLRQTLLSLEKRILRSAALSTAVSSTLVADLTSGSGASPRVMLLPNAAEPRTPEPASDKSRERPTESTVKFTYLGVFQPYYELELVVKAFRLVVGRGMPAELHLYGDGPQFDSIRRLAAADTGVYLHGRYKLDDILRHSVVDEMTVLLLPNRGKGMSEIGSPIKLYEYMSFGRAILASRVGQAVEVLEDGRSCLFYEPGDIDACAAAMERLVREPKLRDRLADEVLRRFLSEHTWEARMKQLCITLEELTDHDD